MAYTDGNCSSLIDLLTSLKVFVEANGWTVDNFQDSLTAVTGPYDQLTGKELHIHKGSAYFHMRTCDNIKPFYSTYQASSVGFEGIALTGSTGYAGSGLDENWAVHTGGPVTPVGQTDAGKAVGTAIHVESGSYPYYMFLNDSNNTFVMCFEYATNAYKWLTFGTLTKFGTWSGGQFFAASDNPWFDAWIGDYLNDSFLRRHMTYKILSSVYPRKGVNSYVNIVGGPLGDGWHTNGCSGLRDEENAIMPGGFHGVCAKEGAGYLGTWEAYQLGAGIYSYAYTNYINGLSEITGRRSMVPILHSVRETEYTGAPSLTSTWFPTGYIPGLRSLNMRYMSPSDEIAFGGDTWKIFPNGAQSHLDGGILEEAAIAVLKEV